MRIDDIGKFVGRYCQFLGWVTIASMIVDPIFFGKLNFDFNFIFFFWAGSCLIKHNPNARKWTIGIAAFVLLCLLFGVIFCWARGTEGIVITLGRTIQNPSMRQLLFASAILGTIAAIPLILLLSPKAKREFCTSENPSEASEQPLRA